MSLTFSRALRRSVRSCLGERNRGEKKTYSQNRMFSVCLFNVYKTKEKGNQLWLLPEFYFLTQNQITQQTYRLLLQALVLKKTIREAGLISDSCLIFNLHLCYFLMSFSFFAASLYHTSLVPFILSSGRSEGPFSLLKNLYLWRTKRQREKANNEVRQSPSYQESLTCYLERYQGFFGVGGGGETCIIEKWDTDRLLC